MLDQISKKKKFLGNKHHFTIENCGKSSCMNVKNHYCACFAWSVASRLYPANISSGRTSSYPHFTTVLNMEDWTFPMTSIQIPKLENINNILVNVYQSRNELKVWIFRYADIFTKAKTTQTC